MNRVILFRGKRIDNGEWIQGSLVTGAFVKSATGQDIPYIFNTDECSNADCFEDFTDDYGYYEVDPATVGQFTGLTDKNGVKIFEGDVLSIEILDEDSVLGSSDFYTGAVIYGRDYKSTNKGKVTSYPCSFTIHCNDWYMEEGLLGMNNYDVEIIGNIHDNPELIKQS